jgi:ribosomal protein L32
MKSLHIIIPHNVNLKKKINKVSASRRQVRRVQAAVKLSLPPVAPSPTSKASAVPVSLNKKFDMFVAYI